MPDPTDAAPTSVLSPELRGASIAIFSTVALSAFEGLAVAAALPQVAADLGGVALLPWVITSYLLTAGVATVAAGTLVDRLGVAPVFRVAVTAFVGAAVVAGLAPSMGVLVAARVVQGIGAGAINAVGLAAVGLVYPDRLVGRAFAANATVWGVMGVAGPGIAAGLLTVASWRWIFLVNLPLGAVSLVAGWRALPIRPPEGEGSRGRLDPVSLGLLAGFTFGVLLAVDRLGWVSLPAAAVAVGCGALLLRRVRGDPDALIRAEHLRDAPLGPLSWTIALLLTGAVGTQTYVPLYVSGSRGVGPGLTAWSVLFFTVGWTLGANVSSRLMDRLPALRVTTLGAGLVVPGCLGVGLLAAVGAPLSAIFALLFVTGAGTGTSTNSALTLLRALVRPAELGRATAAHQFVRNQGFATGNALSGAVILLVVAATTGDVEVVRDAVAGNGDVAVGGVAAALGTGFAAAAVVGAGIALLAQWPLHAVRRGLARSDPADVEAATVR